MTLITVPLAPSYKKAGFSCGKVMLDNYIHTQAKQDSKNKLAQTFVLLDGDVIKGYYSLAATSIVRDTLPEGVVRAVGLYPEFTGTLLGRLAVDNRYQGQGLGALLLIDALKRSYLVTLGSNTPAGGIASFAVVVDPIDEEAMRFYLKYGFILLDSGKMFLTMKTIEQMVSTIL